MQAAQITYKECGIAWLGQIPQHWEAVRLKYVAKQIIGGGTPDTSNPLYWSDADDNAYLWVSIEDITKSSFIKNTKRYITEKGIQSSSTKLIPPFSILYSIYASLGKIAYSDRYLTTNQAILAIQVRDALFYKFLFYSLCATTDNIISSSSMTTQNNISLSTVQNLKIPLPPLEEQKAIARFLDEKCAQIDSLIKKKQKLITLLIEQKQVLISEVVTKGLDPKAPLKDSTIPWLGEIPQHWEVKRLRYIGNIFGGLTGKTAKDFDKESQPNFEPYIPFTNVCKNTVIDSNKMEYVFIDSLECQSKVTKGDIIFLQSSETFEDVGKSAIYLDDQDVYLNTFCKGFRATTENPIFLNYLISSLNYKRYFLSVCSGFTRINLRQEHFLDMPLTLPPLEEQKAIARFLDKRVGEMEAIITKTKEQIKLFKEYKNTLITEATCGRMEIKERK
ncbi:type I restriction enzyme subunit S [Helicobacter mustelae]|uniref:restriction endonuclease subunit S n=1 Tax=Helicobacter mustelae TaxID=217 RepID=UPI000E08A5CB|nr:restriction endonuclease subunit S [Helicobacter mustelae]STP12964.1 type I restriction enzyme subunit S [Helicobacter mustelae]